MRQATSNKPPQDSRAKHRGLRASPVHVFGLAALIGAVLLVILYDLLFGATHGGFVPLAFGVVLFGTAATLAGFRLSRDYPHSSLGLCNLVTLGRLVIVGMLCAVMLAGIAPDWATFGIAALALALDGVDGWLARWQGLSSEFGARFDVEVDAIFALVLAVYAATSGAAGAFVIVLGLPHYLFSVARMGLPWLDQPLYPSFMRKAVCVFQIGALIALQIPLFAQGALDPVIAAVALALIWSFGRDIIWLWRGRERGI